MDRHETIVKEAELFVKKMRDLQVIHSDFVGSFQINCFKLGVSNVIKTESYKQPQS